MYWAGKILLAWGEEIVGDNVGDYVGDEERLHDGDHMDHRVQREINKDNSLYVGETCYSRHAIYYHPFQISCRSESSSISLVPFYPSCENSFYVFMCRCVAYINDDFL